MVSIQYVLGISIGFQFTKHYDDYGDCEMNELIEQLSYWLFADAWRQCQEQYEYGVKYFGVKE
jgi:hypothetical protein